MSTPAADANRTLGGAIRQFRLRRTTGRAKPWTLDELAFAMDDHPAHIGRIERGETIPTRATLYRLCRALALTQPEFEHLFRLAGLSPEFGEPGPAAVRAAIDWVARATRAYAHPLTLSSRGLTEWYANALSLRIMGVTPAAYRACFQGRPFAERIMEPCPVQQIYTGRLRELERVQRILSARVRARALAGDVSLNEASPVLASLHPDADADALMHELSFPGEQFPFDFQYPGRGILRFHTWICPLQHDRRFAVSHMLPRDRETRDHMLEMRHDPRPSRTAPCPVHGIASRLTG